MWIAYYYIKGDVMYLVTVVDGGGRRMLIKQTNAYMTEQYGERGKAWKTKKFQSLCDIRTAEALS